MGILTFNNTSDCRFTQSEFHSQLFNCWSISLALIKRFYFVIHAFVCVFSWTPCEFCSSFFKHISRVIEMCAKKQMVWIYASRIVAAMTNQKIFSNWSMMNFIRKTMGFFRFAFYFDTPIAACKFTSNPLPTGMKRNEFNSFKKALHLASILPFRTGVIK